MLEFDTDIFGCELPIGLGVVEVPIAFPGSDLVDERFDIGDATINGREKKFLFFERKGRTLKRDLGRAAAIVLARSAALPPTPFLALFWGSGARTELSSVSRTWPRH